MKQKKKSLAHRESLTNILKLLSLEVDDEKNWHPANMRICTMTPWAPWRFDVTAVAVRYQTRQWWAREVVGSRCVRTCVVWNCHDMPTKLFCTIPFKSPGCSWSHGAYAHVCRVSVFSSSTSRDNNFSMLGKDSRCAKLLLLLHLKLNYIDGALLYILQTQTAPK